MKKESSNQKVAVLADARAKKEAAAAEKRGSILLNKRDRREVASLKAWEQNVRAIAAPFQQAIQEFLADVQETYNVTLNVTHNLDFANCELVPIPEKKEEAPENPVV